MGRSVGSEVQAGDLASSRLFPLVKESKMRFRVALCCTLLGLLVPAAAAHAGSITMRAAPNPSITGDPVVIYGHVSGEPTGQPIRLYTIVLPRSLHAAEPPYTRIKQVFLSSSGFYEFTVPRVASARHWRVVASKVLKSGAIAQDVIPALSLTGSAASTTTTSPVALSGSISPGHAGASIMLEYQAGTTSKSYQVIGKVRLDRHSHYSLKHTFTLPGTYDVRAVFAKDRQNDGTVSTPATVVVQQAPAAGFSAAASAPVVNPGGNATISGTLSVSGSSLASAGTVLQLWGHTHGAKFAKLAQTTTDLAGHYSFSATPSQSETYEVRVAAGAPRRSAQVVIGVRQPVTISSRFARSGKVGRALTVSGSVAAAAAGQVVALQRRGPHGAWVTVSSTVLRHGSAFRLRSKLGVPGRLSFRVMAPGGPTMVTGISATRTVKVSMPPVQSLPGAR